MIYNDNGQLIGEVSLETPLIDPIDLIGGLGGASKLLLKMGTKLVEKGVSTTVKIGSCELSEHALLRLSQRNITLEMAEKVFTNKPFQYFHEGVWKTGYYDPELKILLGVVNNRMTTIMRTQERYIRSLLKAKP